MADDAPVMEIELAMALEEARSAAASMRSGGPEPYIRCWTSSDEATLFGAWGTREKAHKAVTDTGRWIGSHYASGTGPVCVDRGAVASGQDLAYTVGFERGPVSIDGGPVREMAMRVTQVYRRVDGGWKLVHRHADFAL
ncbi:MAG TPA: nuclear transport factor 2 family protein [Streptosporangiaceae bacterium]|jgi:ketosteroid isomerase-like protein